MRSRRLLVLAATVVILASTGCADFHRGSAPRDGGDLGDGSQVGDPAFEKLVYPILELDCSYCHSANGAAAYTSFVLTGNARLDLAVVFALVSPGYPSSSRLLLQATSDSHGGGKRFATDSSEYLTISDWILGLGATSP